MPSSILTTSCVRASTAWSVSSNSSARNGMASGRSVRYSSASRFTREPTISRHISFVLEDSDRVDISTAWFRGRQCSSLPAATAMLDRHSTRAHPWMPMEDSAAPSGPGRRPIAFAALSMASSAGSDGTHSSCADTTGKSRENRSGSRNPTVSCSKHTLRARTTLNLRRAESSSVEDSASPSLFLLLEGFFFLIELPAAPTLPRCPTAASRRYVK
mmetsp:Transcript_15775/g.37448  ORF Transcript_15775/g.37448 Transcript_15775/m.37448 type:complete len:215 (+) Transcript_15775:121-765(+)